MNFSSQKVLSIALIAGAVSCFLTGAFRFYNEMYVPEPEHNVVDLLTDENGNILDVELFKFAAGTDQGAEINGITLNEAGNVKDNELLLDFFEQNQPMPVQAGFVHFQFEKKPDQALTFDVFGVVDNQDVIQSAMLYVLEDGEWSAFASAEEGKPLDVYGFYDMPLETEALQYRVKHDGKVSLINVVSEQAES